VEHIVAETRSAFEGTPHADSWFFYHDALSLMTAKDTIAWMQSKDYLRRWILPVNGLHDNDPDLKAYRTRPVGDSPESMPWDTSLNNDVHKSVDLHVTMTNHLETGDPRKFDLSTPYRGANAYLRLLHPVTGGVPCSQRIIRDSEKVLESFETIRQADGIKVDGLGNRKGKRHETPGQETRGGARVKKQEAMKTSWLHDDARLEQGIKIESSKRKYEKIEEYENIAED
jgi:hypothetical protein